MKAIFKEAFLMKKLVFILAALLIFTSCSAKKDDAPQQILMEQQPAQQEQKPEEPAEEPVSSLLMADEYSFTEEYFKTEAMTFVSSHRGEFDFTKGGGFTAEEIKHYAVTRTYQILRDSESEIYDDSGELVVPEDLVEDFAKNVLAVDDFCVFAPGKDGYYQVPYSGRYLNAEFSKVETEGIYVVAVMDFYDLDDNDRKGKMLWQMEYGFIPLEYNQMEVFFRPVYARLLAGEEK